MKRDGNLIQWNRCPNFGRQRSMVASAVDAIEQVHGGRDISSDKDRDNDETGGVVTLKIVLTKQQLRQLVASMGRGRNSGAHQVAFPTVMEQLMHVVRMRKACGAGKGRQSGWRPALQSIPEEILD